MLGNRRRPNPWIQAFCLVTIAGYIAAALFLGFTSKRDAFPLFSWSLFSHVPTVKHDFSVLITEVDGRRLEPPLDIMDCGGLVSGEGDIHAYYTIQKLGEAIWRDPGEAGTLRTLLETEYLAGPAGEVKYQIIARSYDPVQKWRHGTYRQGLLAELTRRSER